MDPRRGNVPNFARLGGGVSLLLIGLGGLAIGLGYNGASGTAVLAAQFPYLLSGGILGLALCVVGAALMIVKAHREDRALLERKIDELIDAVGGGLAAADRAPRDLTGLVAAGSASYHVPGCRLVDGREETSYLTPAEAAGTGLKACRVCQPDLATVDVTVR